MQFKFKPSTVYPLLIVVIIAALVFLVVYKNTPSAPEKKPITSGQMPNDEVHRGLGGDPSGGNVSEAVKHQIEMLKKAVEKDPSDTLKVRQYADILAQSHKPEEALTYYEQVLKINPKRSDILFSMSFIAYIKQDFDKSVEYTNRILKFEPKNAQALYNLGAIAAVKGNNYEAKKIWSAVANNNKGTEIGTIAAESIKKLEAAEKQPSPSVKQN